MRVKTRNSLSGFASCSMKRRTHEKLQPTSHISGFNSFEGVAQISVAGGWSPTHQ